MWQSTPQPDAATSCEDGEPEHVARDQRGHAAEQLKPGHPMEPATHEGAPVQDELQASSRLWFLKRRLLVGDDRYPDRYSRRTGGRGVAHPSASVATFPGQPASDPVGDHQHGEVDVAGGDGRHQAGIGDGEPRDTPHPTATIGDGQRVVVCAHRCGA